MTIQEKRNQIAARMNAAYLRYDYAGIDEAGVAPLVDGFMHRPILVYRRWLFINVDYMI